MLPFWTIFNSSDLQCFIVLSHAGIVVSCSKSTILAFGHTTATINPIAVATFFYEICRGIFNYLLGAKSSNKGLFGPVLAYFGTIETNNSGMLHLHCLV